MKRFDRKREVYSGKFYIESEETTNHNQKKPKLSFEFLSGDYCISQCQQREKAEIIDTLHKISQRTWQEIIQLGKSGIGYEQIKLSQLKCVSPKCKIFDNLDKVTIFHKPPKVPIVGFRVEDIFYVFCIDRTYNAYKHNGS